MRNGKFHLLRPLLAGLALCAAGSAAEPASAQALGKISRNVYRIPYADGTQITMSRDYIDHGNTPAGNVGSMDINTSGNNVVIAAAADGVVIAVNDTRTDCGCNSAYGPCANSIRIQHANGEYSTYLHIAPGSATANGIAVNTPVVAGQSIAIEGDIGWTCGSDRNPVAGSCVPSVPSGTGGCGRHLHWDVRRNGTNEYVNPYTCGISNNIYVDNGQYTADTCDSPNCQTDRNLSNLNYTGLGTFRVFQANNVVSASTVTVSNSASVVMHAAARVHLTPGFHCNPGGYFRGEIGSCDDTAVTPSQ